MVSTCLLYVCDSLVVNYGIFRIEDHHTLEMLAEENIFRIFC